MANVRHHGGSRSNEQAVSSPPNLVSAKPSSLKRAALLSWVTGGGVEKMHPGLARVRSGSGADESSSQLDPTTGLRAVRSSTTLEQCAAGRE